MFQIDLHTPRVFVFKSPILMDSSLFFWVYESFIMRRSVKMFPNDIECKTNSEKDKALRGKALKYLNELVVASCVDKKSKQNILKIIKEIKKGEKNDRLLQTMKDVTLHLIRKNCYPIGDDKRNLLSCSHGYVYQYVTNGETKEVVKNDNSKYAICQRQSQINLKTKTDIFLEYLAKLQKNGIEVEIVILPAEYRLMRYSQIIIKAYPLCKRAEQFHISCYNLIPKFIQYYQNNKCNSLYVEGSHLNVLGNEQVVDWILENCSQVSTKGQEG